MAALLAYPVLGTLTLWTGLFEKLVGSEDLKVEIRNPSWTLWPGHVHVAARRVLVNGTTQFKFEAKDLVLHVNLLQLPKKHLHITSIAADDVRYWMRVQVKSPKGIERRLAAYPPLDDLPGKPTIFEQVSAQAEKRESDFTVEIDGIDARVSDLWFMEYHYVGPGTIKGGFLVGPHRMRVGTAVQQLGPGELRFGSTEVIARDLRGRVQAEVPDINPERHADTGFLGLVTANVDLKADVTTLAPMSAYVHGLKIEGGKGPLETGFSLATGRLGEGSHLKFSTEKVGVRARGLGVDTDWSLDARVATVEGMPAGATRQARSGEVLPRVRSRGSVAYVSFTNPSSGPSSKAFTTQIQHHEEEAVLKSPQLGKLTDLQQGEIHLPRITTDDLRDLAAITGESVLLRPEAGTARGSATVAIDEHHVARGGFEATFDGLRFAAGGMQFQTNGGASTRVSVDLDQKVTTASDTTIDLTDLGMKTGKEVVKGWWLRAAVPKFVVWGKPPQQFEGRASVLAKSAEPMLKALAEKKEISKVIPALTKLNDLRIRATVRKVGDVSDIMMEPLQTDLFDVAGRVHVEGRDSRYAVVVGGKAVSLGLGKSQGSTTLKPLAREGWLNDELRTFPKPLELVHSSQP